MNVVGDRSLEEAVFCENDFLMYLISSLESRLLRMEQVSMGLVALCLTVSQELWLGLQPVFMPLWDLTALQQLVRAEPWLCAEGKGVPCTT